MRKWLAGISLPVIAALSTLLASPAQASTLPIKPVKPTPVAGIPEPCVSKALWPKDASVTETRLQLAKEFGVVPVGEGWTKPENREIVKIVWQTFDAISCTSYLSDIKAKNRGLLVINAGPISGWAWGDWGLTRPGMITFDFAKWHQALDEKDPGRLVRLVIHEIGHAYNVDRGSNPAYWTTFKALQAKEGKFSDYAKNNPEETFADTLGYYVARCAKDNPYDTPGQRAYYEYVKKHIFNGATFGPEPGEKPNCSGAGYGSLQSPKKLITDPGWIAPLPGR